MRFLFYMYYTHSGYQTPIFGKNCAYYIRIFTVIVTVIVVIYLCINLLGRPIVIVFQIWYCFIIGKWARKSGYTIWVASFVCCA